MLVQFEWLDTIPRGDFCASLKSWGRQICHLQCFLGGFGEFRWKGRASFNPPSSSSRIWVIGGIFRLSVVQKGLNLESCYISFLGESGLHFW